MRVALLFNPRSAGGATQARMPAIEREARALSSGAVEVLATARPGHAAELAASVRADRLVVVGGDGTVNEVVHGLARRPLEDRPAIGVLPAGTGCDLARTLRMPRDVGAALHRILGAPPRRCDWMRADVGGVTRYAVNVAGLGLSGEVVRAVNAGSKALGGTASFALATARAVAAWRGPTVELCWRGPDGDGAWSGAIASAFIANGRYCGGGMHVAPAARIDDGLLRLVVVPQLAPLRALRYAVRLYDGRIDTVPGVVSVAITSLRATAPAADEVQVDLDGEHPGALPLELSVEPGAVQICFGEDD